MRKKVEVEPFLCFCYFSIEVGENWAGFIVSQLDDWNKGEPFFQVNLRFNAYDALQQFAIGSFDR